MDTAYTFTAHARQRLAEYGWVAADAEHVANHPEASYPGDQGATTSHIGTAPDGRVMRVVLSNAEPGKVITVIWPDSNR